MTKISRNAPCPCGSGLKYKKCCLSKEPINLQDYKPTYHDRCLQVVNSLRSKLIEFIEKSGFQNNMGLALETYWQALDPNIELPEIEKDEFNFFLEWFVHDFLQPDLNKPIVQLFFESNPKLPVEEKQILRDWQDAHISVFQVKKLEVGKGFLAEDIFSGEECFFSDVNLSKTLEKWELITTRKIKVLDEWQPAGFGARESPDRKEDITEFTNYWFKKFKRKYPGTELKTFLRQRGYLFHQRIATLEHQHPELPEIRTVSGEKLEFWEAHYELEDLNTAISKFKNYDDIIEVEILKDPNKQPTKGIFEWVELGRSIERIKKVAGHSEHSMQSFLFDGSEGERYRILGRIEIFPNKLILSASGQERFKLGKEILEETLGEIIQHRIDSVRSPESLLKEAAEKPKLKDPSQELPEEITKPIIKDFMDNHYRKWLDTPLPALNGKTPRQARKTKKACTLLENLLRQLEYNHARNPNMSYDISWIREELNL